MVRVGRLTAVLLVLCIASSSCATPKPASQPGPSVADSPTTALRSPVVVDLSRLRDLNGDFPSDFVPAPPSPPRKTEPDYADMVGNTVSYGRPFFVDPRSCRALLDPVAGKAGADAMGVGAEGPDKQVITVSGNDPVSVVALPPTGCERMAFQVDDDAVITEGVAERLPAPTIEGAVTSALKVTTTFVGYVEYFYVAILGGRTFVQVRARVLPGFPADPLLPSLLDKAVAVVTSG